MSFSDWTIKDYLYVTAECLAGLLALLGNVLVLAAIAKSRALRTVTNCFIGSLAAADAICGLVIPPTTILSYTGLPKNFKGCVLLNSLVVLITNISVLSLLGVALERYMAISRPFTYKRLMTKKRALLVVVVIWIIAILIGLIPLMGWHRDSKQFIECSFTAVIDLKYMVYLVFFGVNVPLLIIMLLVYMYIFYIVKKQMRRTKTMIRQFVSKENRIMQQNQKEARGAKGLAYVIILFALCWLPLHIMNCVIVLAPSIIEPSFFTWLLVAIVLSHVNSVVNPFLYAFSNSSFKYVIMQIVCCERGLSHGYESSRMSSIRTRNTKQEETTRRQTTDLESTILEETGPQQCATEQTRAPGPSNPRKVTFNTLERSVDDSIWTTDTSATMVLKQTSFDVLERSVDDSNWTTDTSTSMELEQTSFDVTQDPVADPTQENTESYCVSQLIIPWYFMSKSNTDLTGQSHSHTDFSENMPADGRRTVSNVDSTGQIKTIEQVEIPNSDMCEPKEPNVLHSESIHKQSTSLYVRTSMGAESNTDMGSTSNIITVRL